MRQLLAKRLCERHRDRVADLRELCRLASEEFVVVGEALEPRGLADGERSRQVRMDEVREILSHVCGEGWTRRRGA